MQHSVRTATTGDCPVNSCIEGLICVVPTADMQHVT